jgi:hypothetical protein
MASTIQHNIIIEKVEDEINPSTVTVVTIDKKRLEHLLYIEKNYINIIAQGVAKKLNELKDENKEN